MFIGSWVANVDISGLLGLLQHLREETSWPKKKTQISGDVRWRIYVFLGKAIGTIDREYYIYIYIIYYIYIYYIYILYIYIYYIYILYVYFIYIICNSQPKNIVPITTIPSSTDVPHDWPILWKHPGVSDHMGIQKHLGFKSERVAQFHLERPSTTKRHLPRRGDWRKITQLWIHVDPFRPTKIIPHSKVWGIHPCALNPTCL